MPTRDAQHGSETRDARASLVPRWLALLVLIALLAAAASAVHSLLAAGSPAVRHAERQARDAAPDAP